MSTSMDDSLLRKYTGRDERAAAPEESDESRLRLDCGAFGWLRGLRDRALMLQLKKKNGNIRAVAYNMIEQVDYDPSDGITIRAAGHQIRIRGRNLNAEVRPFVQLFDGLTRQRVPWVREASYQERVGAPADACVIESIEFDSP